jgi:outer membrane protein assembly factor BamB
MYHGDPSHSGLSQSMPNVSGSPRVTESIKLDGAVYASPIAVDGVIVVATQNDSVYAFDAQGRQLWHVKVGSPSPAQERACGDIDPLGITGTPIYSAQTGDVYLVAEHNGKVGHDMMGTVIDCVDFTRPEALGAPA